MLQLLVLGPPGGTTYWSRFRNSHVYVLHFYASAWSTRPWRCLHPNNNKWKHQEGDAHHGKWKGFEGNLFLNVTVKITFYTQITKHFGHLHGTFAISYLVVDAVWCEEKKKKKLYSTPTAIPKTQVNFTLLKILTVTLYVFKKTIFILCNLL